MNILTIRNKIFISLWNISHFYPRQIQPCLKLVHLTPALTSTTVDAPSDDANTESLEDKETDDFLDEMYEKKIKQDLLYELCSFISPEEVPERPNNVSSTEIISSCVNLESMISGSTQHLSYLFETAVKSSQQEILDWHNYSFEFESKIDTLTADGRIEDKRQDQ
ncbi:hypothetical protein RhiirA5_418041 [Rhizophagus irregularis]|uniref:Uncharacterized protein n=1 Tax=Rhizophagus irregularis TaxID=588596 RepID=A0A2N0RL56_9GLOM|nr:hypothetical protein RhiirA5_418041 [Rhizophagus irregularis]PKC64015.1 hypothetical protein RhiirA1_463027 [Rhizophagus irregularis]